jgi:hypothetical protein
LRRVLFAFLLRRVERRPPIAFATGVAGAAAAPNHPLIVESNPGLAAFFFIELTGAAAFIYIDELFFTH